MDTVGITGSTRKPLPFPNATQGNLMHPIDLWKHRRRPNGDRFGLPTNPKDTTACIR